MLRVMIDVFAPGMLSPILASILFALFGLGGPAAFLMVQIQSWFDASRGLKAASLNEREATSSAPLKDGPAVLFGVVESADRTKLVGRSERKEGLGKKAVAKVVIMLEGKNLGGKHPAHEWMEVSRTAQAAHFYLQPERGPRILVEPPENFSLVDSLVVRAEGHSKRKGIASLDIGEKVYVSGTLEGIEEVDRGAVYRDSPTVPTFRAKGGSMLLSTRPLTEPYREEALLRRKRIRWTLAIWLVPFVLCFARYLAAMSFGTIEMSGEKWTSIGSTKSGRYTIYNIGQGTLCSTQTNGDAYAALESIPMLAVRTPLGNFCQAGRAASYSFQVLFLYLVAEVLGLYLLVEVTKKRPWYRQKKLRIRAPGPLPEFEQDKGEKL